ncbi:MAG: cation transporting ATPase C-terminal domain-containing protein [Candidatus Hadarchaeota archaeon]
MVSRNFTEVAVILLGITVFLDFDHLPLLAMQILFLNVIGQEMPAVALGLDPASEHIMDRPPKNTSLDILHKRNVYFIVPMAIYMAFAAFAAYLYIGPDSNVALARTVIFSSIVLMIMINTFNFKSLEKTIAEVDWLENKLLWISLATITPILLVIIYHPILAVVFEHEPLAVNHWTIALIVALSTVVIIEVLKKISNSMLDTSYMWKGNLQESSEQ